ncbi:MAG: nucleotidyltransferase domain-containing protein [Patescibacteria group bacterium]|nr:nucleotidyltransferase domain-containing protein [Patescibacteria group bacterium]
MDKTNEIKLQILPILREAEVSRSFIFGSYAKNKYKKNSDLDLLVEFNKSKSLLDLIALKLKLEKKMGIRIKVDILTSNSIHPDIRNLIQKEKIQIL